MRVPRHWLHELVDVSDVATEELAERLSHTGSAVDAIERFAPGVSGVVVGRVLDVQDAEGSDKLCIAHIDIGSEKLTILAGAKNFNQGDVVPVAKVGARVTTLDVPIGRRKMMDKYESEGMLCSAKELGIDDDHGGILVLDESVSLGTDVARLLGLDDDVLEFEIYPNRPDQMSVLGIAREVALVCERELRSPSFDVVEEGPAPATSVTIEDGDGCPRYLARVIDGVRFGPSPALVRSRLTACGMRPLGNLVDITNYVLLLTGQPLHAFDMDKLGEQRIVVRRARPGETLRSLDGTDRKLEATDLVIADASTAQALAGVMGGEQSEVSDATTRVLLESAYFEPIGISRTSRRHHLRSEASARFERGADPEMVPEAAALAAEMFRTLAGGTVANGAVDEGDAPARRRLVLRPGRIEAVLGIEVADDDVARILTGLGCDVSAGDVVPPSWRPDLEREIDLIEEVARIHGYEKIPTALALGDRGGRSDEQILRERIRDTLIGAGLTEVTLQTFIPPEDIKTIGYDGDLVRVSNPMTEDQAQLRPSLFPGLLRAAQRNVARGIGSVRLFEFGKLFRGWPQGSALPDESEHVAFVLVGAAGEHWSGEAHAADAFDAKGLIELVCDELGITGWTLRTDTVAPMFHPGRAADLLIDGGMAGRFGEVRPSIAR
ncbi:MAG: phenylalanine--tRNA ligase subunit beta, partial [Actinomycetota bacterium]